MRSKNQAQLYPMELRWSEEDRAWLAEVYDLPGCIADGATQEAAIKAAIKAARLWIEVAREAGRVIPPPSSQTEASGRFLVRLSRSLHVRLQRMARRENVSLNQLVSLLLAEREAERRAGGGEA